MRANPSLLRRALLFAYLIFLATFLTGCTVKIGKRRFVLPSIPCRIPIIGECEEQKPAHLTYWGLWEPKEVIQPLIDEYQAKHPNITIEYNEKDPRQFLQNLSAYLTTENPPDIIRIHSTWVPYLYPYLEPIPKDIMDVETYEQTYYPVTKQTLFFQGNYYAIPLGMDGLALVYNVDLLQQAGLNAAPTTWTEFREYARKLTKKDANGRIIVSGAALGFGDQIDYFSDILGLMFAQNGVSFMSDKGEVTFHNTLGEDERNLGAEALTFYTLFGTSEKSYDPSLASSTVAFGQGKVAMVLLPSHRLLEIIGINPNLNFRVVPAPQLPPVDPSQPPPFIHWANYWVEVVPKNSLNSRAAWRFLQFMSQAENLTTFYRNASQIRLFGEPYPRKDMSDDLQGDRYTSSYTQQGKGYTTWYFAYGTYADELNGAIVKVLARMVDNISLRGANLEAELDTAATEVQTILDSYGR